MERARRQEELNNKIRENNDFRTAEEIQADTIDEAKSLVITECLRKLGEL